MINLRKEEAKLLGVKISDTQKWGKQINGVGGVVSALNQINFILRRLRNHLDKPRTKKVADSIWTSKLRYGLQLYGPIRKETADSHSVDLDRLQTAQNNMLRTLENIRISYKISAKSLLERNQMLSVNRTPAQIKLMEMWKSKNIESYPLKPEIVFPIHNGATTRNATCEKFKTNNTVLLLGMRPGSGIQHQLL